MRTFLVNETSENVWFDQFRIQNTTPVILQETHYDPWGVELQGLGYQQGGIKANKYLYNGKEFNDHLGINLSDYGARMYDASIGRWWVVDPLAEREKGLSPFRYSYNNPLRFIDPTGKLETDFLDKQGKSVKHVEDGSNAVFKQQGEGNSLHYSFSGYSDQGGKNEVNVTTAIQEQQALNIQNPKLQENADGNNETHCNQATQAIQKTVQSINKDENVVVPGRANDMITNLSSNPSYQKVSIEDAKKNAEQGGLSIIGYQNLNGGSGHVVTFSVGENLGKGETANIGPKSYSGFVSLNSAISQKKEKSYFIYVGK